MFTHDVAANEENVSRIYRRTFLSSRGAECQNSWTTCLYTQFYARFYMDAINHVITSPDASLSIFLFLMFHFFLSGDDGISLPTSKKKLFNQPWLTLKRFNIFFSLPHAASAIPYSLNIPTETSCVNWNQYYTNCTQLGGNPFQGTISFDNIGLAWVAIFLVIITIIKLYVPRKEKRNRKTFLFKASEKVFRFSFTYCGHKIER